MVAAVSCMFCDGAGCRWCQGDPLPEWFTANKRAGGQLANVKRGRHPMGAPLLKPQDPEKKCGTCRHHHKAGVHGHEWHKCRLHETSSEATDIRARWPGCTSWMAWTDQA
jgi:hypothetical protein